MDSPERFELVKLLGMGGFAQTYHARVLDPDLVGYFGAEEVALKIPLNKKKEIAMRRELEINIALYLRIRKAELPNIVRYLGIDDYDGRIVMAMEYVSGGNLRALMGSYTNPRPLPPAEATRLTIGVLEGLTVIHQEHILHRDIKPENILMSERTPKIADLGVGRMLESDELASTTTGTVYYMAPEVLFEEGATFPADLWSVGVMFYEMLTGRLPFGNLHTPIGALAELIKSGRHEPACSVRREVSPELSAIVDRALSKRPAERFASAAQMRDALLRVGSDENEKLERELAEIRRVMDSNERRVLADAERRLSAMVAKHPAYGPAYVCLGELYNRCFEYDKAIRAFEAAHKHNPGNFLIDFYLAMAYRGKGDRQQAKAHLRRVAERAEDTSLRHHAQVMLNTL